MARGPKSKSKGAVVGGTVVGGNGTVSGPATVYTAVQNATDLAGAVNTAVQKKIESRPKGTSSSYDPKQKKWAVSSIPIPFRVFAILAADSRRPGGR
ncbi:unnamed protein product [Tilletia controversa]|nr:unnamed protein product [Tilletia controversa]